MNIKRRLIHLESIPTRRRALPLTGIWSRENFQKTRALQKKLCLPLPAEATDDELREARRLLVAAQARLRIDPDDTSAADELREFCIAVHEKYGTTPFWDTIPG